MSVDERPVVTDEPTRVNVIYVGGTVAALRPFLDSLIGHTDFPLRLVLNACDAAEHAMLDDVRRQHPDRVELYVVPGDHAVGHGEMLHRLLDIETSPYFCFFDSDILAVARTELSELMPGPGEVARCMCLPFWQSPVDAVMPRHTTRVDHRFLRTENGESLGCTYAATYRTAELREAIERWGTSLRFLRWADLSAGVRGELERRNLRHGAYDTAKVVNVLLQADDATIGYRPTPSLVHVGAMSRMVFERDAGPAERRRKQRMGRFARRRTPALYRLWALTWVTTHGRRFAELREEVDVRLRLEKVVSLVDGVRRGTATADDVPDWIEDRAVFDVLTRHLGPRAAELTRR